MQRSRGLTKNISVGRSARTPAKHAAMGPLFDREVGILNMRKPQFADITRLVWFDLSAGDGFPDEGEPWSEGCSPGITASRATRSRRPVELTLFEINAKTFDLLTANLVEQLPALGYRQVGDHEWRYRDTVTLRAIHGSGHEARVDGLRRRDAVLASNDPNSMATWAMRPTFAAEIAGRAWCFRSISTMGCNVSGLMREDRSERDQWKKLVQAQVIATPRWRDTMLAVIKGDSAKWGYLINDARKFRANTERDFTGAFARYNYTLRTEWQGRDPDRFRDLMDRLFLRRDEYAAECEGGLW